ncbi:MAG: hypothetical protein AB8F94_22925 [Saprospiraceae bacterium]
MNNQITPFIEVSFKHLFFSDGNMRDIQIVPTRETANLMKNIGLLLKAGSANMLLGYTETTKQYLAGDPSKIMLAFAIKSTDPFFQNYTQMPSVIPGKKAFYFDNLNWEANENNLTLLHDGDYVEDENLIELSKPEFEVKLEEGTTEIVILDQLENEIAKYELEGDENMEKVLINLAEVGSGLFHVVQSNGKYSSVYIADSLETNNLGILHLFFDLEMLEAQEFSEGNIIKWNYKIRFLNRVSYWKYYFIKTDNLDGTPNFEITHPEEDIVFSLSEEVHQLPNSGGEAWLMISQTPIPAKEKYSHHFSVTFKTNPGSESKITMPLPNADVKNIKIGMKDSKEIMYSDMYIYI